VERNLGRDVEPVVTAEPLLLPLDLPAACSRAERLDYSRLCRFVAAGPGVVEAADSNNAVFEASGTTRLYSHPFASAAGHVIIDLVRQGWRIEVDRHGVLASPPDNEVDLDAEKARIRRQELVGRDAQLRSESVRRFVREMERPRIRAGRATSVFSLMRDGNQLANALESHRAGPHDSAAFGRIIRPYAQLVTNDEYCEYTGLRLVDIWRYFRHTWSNSYATVPGRTMQILVRDAAIDSHPVIGIAALASPVVQIAARDRWIGWDSDVFLNAAATKPSIKTARWVARRLNSQVAEIYIDDLAADGLIDPSDVANPTQALISALRADSERQRQRHHRFGKVRVTNQSRSGWEARAESALFRSKRSLALADALEMRRVLLPYFSPHPTIRGLAHALDDAEAYRQLRRLVRKARGERVGTVVADLSVCGAIPPYSPLVAGKLVAALAISPRILRAYEERYSRPSEIASAIAGRPIVRDARLSFIGTTSLYGAGSSQYNRLYWPAATLGGDPADKLGFHPIGRSRSFGTSQFSVETVESLTRLIALSGNMTRVNSLFGEGVSPRLRKVRLGLAALGWPSNELLKHGRYRLVYGAPLVRNLTEFALGVDRDPEYLMDTSLADDQERMAQWWYSRWALPRMNRDEVMDEVRRHRTTRPISHGARVTLPYLDEEGALFGDDLEQYR
jgi:hypothetical protein